MKSKVFCNTSRASAKTRSGCPPYLKALGCIPALTRPGLAALVALSALSGYVLPSTGAAISPALVLWTGVFLLATGATALNQVQERDIDLLMERTRNRPLPQKKLLPAHALAISLTLSLAGAGILLPFGIPAFLLGIFALLWYNGLYTPMKRLSRFAALPGALCGALPPMLGWVAGGGLPWDRRIILFCGLLILWQLPHCWLLTLKHPDDNHSAGLPSPLGCFEQEQLLRLCRFWLLALATALPLLLPFRVVISPVPRAGIILAIIIAWSCTFAPHSRQLDPSTLTRLHRCTVAVMTLLLLSLTTEGLIS